mgnify:CR=1|tara:strand:+ start:58 stop:207 length:150 start_codon:yes stop_codon:yes gene_type:complete
MSQVRGNFERVLVEVDTLPPISNVFQKITEITNDEGGSRDELIHCVTLD